MNDISIYEAAYKAREQHEPCDCDGIGFWFSEHSDQPVSWMRPCWVSMTVSRCDACEKYTDDFHAAVQVCISWDRVQKLENEANRQNGRPVAEERQMLIGWDGWMGSHGPVFDYEGDVWVTFSPEFAGPCHPEPDDTPQPYLPNPKEPQ